MKTLPHYSSYIVDNEPKAREVIRILLEDLFANIEVIGEANGLEQGIDLFESEVPDILFLDIEMNDGSGFDLLNQLGTRLPKIVIFVTAYDQYAIKAIRASAFDYILKPINRSDFYLCVNRALQQLSKAPEPIGPLSIQLSQKVIIPTLTGMRFVKAQEVTRCEAHGNYTVIRFADGSKETVSRSLGQYEHDLAQNSFLRIHHKHLVNLDHISAYKKGKAGGSLVMSDGSEVEVSTRKKTVLLQLITQGK